MARTIDPESDHSFGKLRKLEDKGIRTQLADDEDGKQTYRLIFPLFIYYNLIL